MNRFYWRAISKYGRSECINEITAIINNLGYIADFKRFSDIALSFIIEIHGDRIPELIRNLSELTVLDTGINSEVSKSQNIIQLHITFPAESGKLKIEVPEVPG